MVLPPLLFEMRLLEKKTPFGKALERNSVGSFSRSSDVTSRDIGGPVELLSVEWKFLAGLPLHLLKCEGEEWSLGKGVENLYRIFFLELEILNVEISQWLIFIRQQGAWGGSQRWGPSLRHTYLPLGERPAWLVQSKGHQNTTSWVQPSRNWPTSPTILLSQEGRKKSPPFFLLCQS